MYELLSSYVSHIQTADISQLSVYNQSKLRLGMLYFDRIRIGITMEYQPLLEVLDTYTFELLPHENQNLFLLDVLTVIADTHHPIMAALFFSDITYQVPYRFK
jgi:hypothetical protein